MTAFVLSVGALVIAPPDVVAPVGAAPVAKPTAIVALGDSASAGQSANDYEAGTDTATNQCRRSAHAFVRQVRGFDASFNLACSGATVADVIDRSRGGEAPQVEQLAAIATSHDVRVVTLQIGANDDIDFAGVVERCVRAFFRPGGCRTDDVFADIDASAAKLATAIDAVQSTMLAASYRSTEWQLVVLSYASPVTPDVRSRFTKAIEGCPVDSKDLRWAKQDMTPAIATAYRATAETAGVRFLDLSTAFDGREVCASGARPWNEWATGLLLDASEAISNGISNRVFSESFHPNARGHAAIAACVTQAVATPAREQRCVRSGDRLHAEGLP
jgi:lysophospholipase L1-like esterase